MDLHLIILILHVLGAGLVIGVVVLALLAVIKPPVTAAAMERLHFVSRFGMAASIWQFFTGLYLAYADWDELKSNRVFWTKLILYVVEGMIAATLLDRLSRRTAAQTATGTTTAGPLRLTLIIHALLILAIAALGVVLVEG